ncbi:MAG: site-specific integrase [Clostridiales bacterium]|nr:site-specific integrase [Clostridiales bacterium]
MSASKDQKRGTWKVYIRYIDWRGEKQIKTKRGFATKREALQWEREFLQKQSKDVNMSFKAFTEIYLRDIKPRIKYSTYLGKKNMFESKILPYFGKKALAEIKASDVIQWQNELLQQRDEEGNAYTPTYLRTIQNQLSALFNHAVKFYGLPVNPSAQAGKMGKSNAKAMLFWTQDEYLQFIQTMKEKPLSYYSFEMLYWTGIRVGELLALTPSDFDFKNRLLSISKSYQRLEGKDYITEPKTEQSNRTIAMPDFLCVEMEDFLASLYGLELDMRIFQVTKSYLHHEMDRGCKQSGVKRIRIHDLRHSHVAHLIELGFSPVAIAERLGHKGISITYMYAHLYPSKRQELADKLGEDREKAEKLAEKNLMEGHENV